MNSGLPLPLSYCTLSRARENLHLWGTGGGGGGVEAAAAAVAAGEGQGGSDSALLRSLDASNYFPTLLSALSMASLALQSKTVPAVGGGGAGAGAGAAASTPLLLALASAPQGIGLPFFTHTPSALVYPVWGNGARWLEQGGGGDSSSTAAAAAAAATSGGSERGREDDRLPQCTSERAAIDATAVSSAGSSSSSSSSSRGYAVQGGGGGISSEGSDSGGGALGHASPAAAAAAATAQDTSIYDASLPDSGYCAAAERTIDSAEAALGRPLVFSSGYSDGGLRWWRVGVAEGGSRSSPGCSVAGFDAWLPSSPSVAYGSGLVAGEWGNGAAPVSVGAASAGMLPAAAGLSWAAPMPPTPPVTCVASTSSGAPGSDPHTLLTGHSDGSVRVWRVFSGPCACVEASAAVASGGGGGSGGGGWPVLWGPSTGSLLLRTALLLPPPTSAYQGSSASSASSSSSGAFGVVSSLAHSPTAGFVAAGSVEGWVTVWSTATGACVSVRHPLQGLLSEQQLAAAHLGQAVRGAQENTAALALLPVQGLRFLGGRGGGAQLCGWWSCNSSNVSAAGGGGGLLPLSRLVYFCAPSGQATGVASLGGKAPTLPASPSAAVQLRRTLASTPWVTSMLTSADGSACLVGLSSGVVQSLHALTLEAGGWMCCHGEAGGQQAQQAQPALWNGEIVVEEVASAAAGAGTRESVPAPRHASGPTSPAPARTLQHTVAAKASSLVGGVFSLLARTPLADTHVGSGMLAGIARLQDSLSSSAGARSGGAGGASAYLLATAQARAEGVAGGVHGGRVLPGSAVCSLAYSSPGESLLLLGCGDGRLVCAVDATAAATADEDFSNTLLHVFDNM